MSITSSVSGNGKQVNIIVSGKFDFQLYDDFRASYANTAGKDVHYVVDLNNTDYLDSSALGMLLLLREHAGGDSSRVEIIKPSAQVKKVLDVANFEKLFDIKT